MECRRIELHSHRISHLFQDAASSVPPDIRVAAAAAAVVVAVAVVAVVVAAAAAAVLFWFAFCVLLWLHCACRQRIIVVVGFWGCLGFVLACPEGKELPQA